MTTGSSTRSRPGDHIHATLVMTEHAELTEISFTKSSQTEGDGTSRVRIPEAGDTVPELHVSQPVWQDSSAGAVSREASAADVHLHALPDTRLLPADQQPFR